MIVVDTSVWVDVMRRPTTERATTFRQLLDADEVALPLPVRIELMTGVTRAQRAALKRALSGLPLVHPTEETWRTLDAWVAPAADAGLHFSVTDLLIAALAREMTALVWSLDVAFANMATLGFVQLYD